MSLFRVLIPIIIAFVAYIYITKYSSDDDVYQIKNIIRVWEANIKDPDVKFPRVAVGVNVAVDLIVRATDVFGALDVRPGGKEDHPVLTSLDQLQETFHTYFAQGAGAERFFNERETFRTIVDAADGLKVKEYSIGGNAGLMARKIVEDHPSTRVQLVGPVGPKLKKLLPAQLEIPHNSHIPVDQVHLIMEYSVGDTWGQTQAPVATRFIISSDTMNARMSHLEPFFSSLESFSPSLVILSGVAMLDSQEEDKWRHRLAIISEGLEELAPSVPTHLEIASMANSILVAQIFESIVRNVDSIGLNEQELGFATRSVGGPHPDLNSLSIPEIKKVGDILVWLLATYGQSTSKPHNKLTRVHFHSLAYHIIATVGGRWQNQKSAVMAGTRIAGKQACDTTEMDPYSYTLQIPKLFRLSSDYKSSLVEFDAENPVIIQEVRGITLSFSPVLVCRNPLKTVGLGDAISSTALMYSSYHYDA